ncbi:MAG: CinA family protein [Pseudomonadota bacterium]
MKGAAETVLRRARAQGLRITTAESCTGGLLAGAITEVAGASDIFERGFITYSNPAKEAVLGVSADTLAQFGAVSEPVAGEMAMGAIAASQADLAVSVTGIAGPGGSEFKPEGRVCFGLAQRGSGVIRAETVEFGALGRSAVRAASVAYGLDLLLAALREGLTRNPQHP